MRLRFYVDNNDDAKNEPHLYLHHINWDDYNRKTSFSLSYIDSKGAYHGIGRIKIMHEDEYNTLHIIPKDFDEIPDQFCSLGQNIDFYEDLKYHLGEDTFYQVLHNLNDIAFLPAIRDRFEHNRSFRVSLLRTSEAEKTYHEARQVIENLPIKPNFIFNYACQLPNTEGKHIVKFNFGDSGSLKIIYGGTSMPVILA